MSTKIVVTATAKDTAVAVVPGQAGDAPLLVPLLKLTLRRVRVIDELVGDYQVAGMERGLQAADRRRPAGPRSGRSPI